MSAATALAFEKAPRRVSRHPVNVPLDLIALRSGVPENLPGRCTDIAKLEWAQCWPENYPRPTCRGRVAVAECGRAGSSASPGPLSVAAALRAGICGPVGRTAGDDPVLVVPCPRRKHIPEISTAILETLSK